MSDFMGGMFDFNGDGHTDVGEEFMAYQIYEDMTEKKTDSLPPRTFPQAEKLDGWDIIIIILFACQILCWIADAIY